MELGLQIKAATIKVSVLSQALEGAKGEWRANDAIRRYRNEVRNAAAVCNATAEKVRRFDKASFFERTRQEIFATSRADLIQANQNACNKWRQKNDNLTSVLNAQSAARNRATFLRHTAVDVFEKGVSDLRGVGHMQDGRTLRGYLSGRTSLFRDRVDKGDGILIVEEAPLSARGSGDVKRGLEGAFDAALKVFGI